MQNEELRAENTRLSDLSRLLFSSPAFSTFLSELNNGVPTLPSNETQQQQQQQQQPQMQQQPQHAAPPPQPQRTVKDVNPHQSSAKIGQHGDAQISMAMLPETNMDFRTVQSMNSAWGSGIDFGMHNMQVFSVAELPDGPAIDIAGLSEKPSVTAEPVSFASEQKVDAPSIEVAFPSQDAATPVEDTDMDFDESDPAFALFLDAPAQTTPATNDGGVQLFGHIQPEKAFARLDLLIDDGATAGVDEDKEINVAVMARFEAACASLNTLSARIASVTSHLRR